MSIVTDITGHLAEGPASALDSLLFQFAEEFGWRPCEAHVENVRGSNRNFRLAHLRVEHGIESSAVITFQAEQNLTNEIRTRGHILSYNHGIDFHIFVTPTDFILTNNRLKAYELAVHDLTRDINQLHSSNLQSFLSARSGRADYPRVEIALLEHIYFCKNILQQPTPRLSNAQVSDVLNSLIFLRAYQDVLRHKGKPLSDTTISAISSGTIFESAAAITRLSKQLAQELNLRKLPDYIDLQACLVLRDVKEADRNQIISGFFEAPGAPLPFDFSQLSKHTLSRVFERYISDLEFGDDGQLRLFDSFRFATEKVEHKLGMVYTPEYIPAYFARLIELEIPTRLYGDIHLIDPACGSGIFPRAIIERLIETRRTKEAKVVLLEKLFSNLYAADINSSACNVAKLSLALLYLTVSGSLPASMNIVTEDAMESQWDLSKSSRAIRVITTNPPFKRYERLTVDEKTKLRQLLGPSVIRPDLYLGFLKRAVDLCQEGDMLGFVLPHKFSLADNAGSLRSLISDSFDLLALIDLTAVKVFGEVQTYIELLFARRRLGTNIESERLALIAQVSSSTGQAITDISERKEAERASHRSSLVDQRYFGEGLWIYLDSRERRMHSALQDYPKLSEVAHAGQGINTGADSVFLRRMEAVPENEAELYVPFMPDKEIRAFQQATSDWALLYPYRRRVPLSLEDLEAFPETLAHLRAFEAVLRDRKGHRSELWWLPTTPRLKLNMFRPKLIMPHVMKEVRVGVDRDGQYAVSRSPIVIPHSEGLFGLEAERWLDLLLGILNSELARWYFRVFAHRLRDSSSMVEANTLAGFPVPSATQLDGRKATEIISLAQRLGTRQASWDDYDKLNKLVFALYEIDPLE